MNTMRPLPRIGIVQGDACGIAPELQSKLLEHEEIHERAQLLVISDKRVFDAGSAVSEIKTNIKVISTAADIRFSPGHPQLLDTPCLDPQHITPGEV